MRHVLTFLSKGVGFKLVALLLAVGIVALVFQLSSAFRVHALNVKTEIKSTPPGIAKIIDRTGRPPAGLINPQSNRPTALIINTDVDFGTVFPGETVKGKFIVYLDKVTNTSSNTSWNTTYTWITYNVTLLEELDYTCEDIRPYLIVERDTVESDNETDPLADGTNNDYFARGSLNFTDNDTFDKWFVTFNVTDNISLNDYGAEVLIEVIDGEKAGG